MNPLSYYERSKAPWTPAELEQVRKEYETDLLDIIQIANTHKRTPGCIAYKLKALGLITHPTVARGHIEYRTSSLYTEICLTGKEADQAKRAKKDEAMNVVVSDEPKKNKPKTSDVLFELNRMKQDISEMKKDIKQMLIYITAVYNFETSE